MTPAGALAMTSPAKIQVAMIAALLATIDADDEKDAKTAVEMIRGLLGQAEAK